MINIQSSFFFLYLSLIISLSFFSILGNHFNNIYLAIIIYTSIALIFAFFYNKNLKELSKFIIFFFLILIIQYLLMHFSKNSLFYFLPLISILFFFYTFYILLKSLLKSNFIFLDYIFILIVFSSLLSILIEINYNFLFLDIVNSLLNFRFYIFNIFFYILARILINDVKNIYLLIKIFIFTSTVIIFYTYFEITLLQFTDDLNNLEWLYTQLKAEGTFPHSFVLTDYLVNSKYLPLGHLNMPHFSGFYNMLIFFFINSILIYKYFNFYNPRTRLIIFFLLFNSLFPIIFLWSSKTILVSYFGVFLMSIILLSILKIKNNLKNLLSYTLIFIIFIPLVVTNFSYFGFKRDYLGSLQYPYSSEIPRMADSYELICLLNDKINCERPNGENYFIILEIDNNLLDMNNNTLIIDYNFIGRKLEFGINKNNPPKLTNDKFDQHSDYKLLFNIKEFSINNINCNYKNKDGFCSILTKDNNNYYLNLKYIKEIYNTQKIYLTLNLSEFLIRGININDIKNNNLLRIIPKVNKYFKNCSIDRFINPQKFINLNCNNDINKKTKIIYSNEDKNYFNIKLNNGFELINNLDYTINITGIFYRLKKLFIKDFQTNVIENYNIDNNPDKNLVKNKTIPEKLFNYRIFFGSNSFLNHEINNFKSLSNKSHDYHNYKKQISTESDIPILNFLGENGIITTLLCFIFFSVSLYLTINNLFKSKDIFIKFISFFSFCSLTAICIGMFHLNLLFKIEIGYLIFTIIGINANLYLKNYKKRLYE